MPRGPNWSHDETKILAEEKLRRINEDGMLMWERIAEAVSNRFPGRAARSAKACRYRWDTVVKDYTHIQSHCKQCGRLELSEGEILSMELPTAYRRDWYIIVKEVCDRKPSAKNATDLNIQHTASTTLVFENDGPTLDDVAKAWNIQHAAASETNGEPKTLAEVTEAHWDQWADEAKLTMSEQETEQANEQVERTTMFVPKSVERKSASHIAGEQTFGLWPEWTFDETSLLQSLMSQSMPTQENTTISSAFNKTGNTEQRNHPT